MSIEDCMKTYSVSKKFRLPYRDNPLDVKLQYITLGFFCISDEEPWS